MREENTESRRQERGVSRHEDNVKAQILNVKSMPKSQVYPPSAVPVRRTSDSFGEAARAQMSIE
jgi:hypothetical protein